MKIQPYLFFEGRCDEAVAFYRAALQRENPRGQMAAGVFVKKTRQHLLSHFWYYHWL